jgi:hypothetical protein
MKVCVQPKMSRPLSSKEFFISRDLTRLREIMREQKRERDKGRDKEREIKR